MPLYHLIRPWEDAPVTPANAAQVLVEAEQARQSCPHCTAFVWSYKARALGALGRHDEATDAARPIPVALGLY